jgi:hypothetical protein
MMQTDFFNAYQRHYKDAEYLYDASRWANADHLYGFSAECGLKCIMQSFGMRLDPVKGTPPKKDKVHIDQVWDRYETYRAGMGAAEYALPQPNPFAAWNVSDRYAHETGFTQTLVEQHKTGFKVVQALIYKAILDGRLTI